MESYYYSSDTGQDKSECYKVNMITISVQTLDKVKLAGKYTEVIISVLTLGKIELYNLYGELLLLSVLVLENN